MGAAEYKHVVLCLIFLKYISDAFEEMHEKLNISVKGIEWQLRNLREKGILKRMDPDKGGYWEIIGK